MAHNIMNRDGRDAMFVVGERDAAWHRLGQHTPGCVSWHQAMELAGLDWSVEKRQLYGRDPDAIDANPYTPLAGTFGVFRTDDNVFLGSVGSKYKPIQNRDAFHFVDTLLEATNGAHYDSAGALGNGERVWCSAKVPFDFEPVPGDSHQTYLMFTTSHDGQTSAMCKLTTVRVVCQNTLTASIADAGAMVRIRHTASAGERLGRAAELMQGVGANVAALSLKLTNLAAMEINQEFVDKVLDRLFPAPADGQSSPRRLNTMAGVLNLYANNDGGAVAGIAGTAYNLLNAVTEYADHLRPVRGGNGDPLLLAANRAESAIWGSGDDLKHMAMDAIQLVASGN